MKKNIKLLDTIPLDVKLMDKLIYLNQQEYIRKKLRFIKDLYQTKHVLTSSTNLKINPSTGHSYLNIYLQQGLKGLAKKKTKPSKQRLSPQNKQKLKEIILTKTPQDYDIDRYIWTGWVLEIVIKKEFGVDLKDSRIYEILDEIGLSHQKAHRDYENADPKKQKEFQENFKKKSKKLEN